jgi:RNA polymerase sigma factor (sigma-70 family)
MGGSGGFDEWYRREHPRLVASLLLISGDIEAATEATDEALARAFLHWDRVRAMESPGGWTHRVALNVLRRRKRRQTLERRLLARQHPAREVPAPAGEAWLAVRDLPPRQRVAIVLRYVADLPESEIASAMGISRSGVASALADARRNLAAVLKEDTTVLEPRCV